MTTATATALSRLIHRAVEISPDGYLRAPFDETFRSDAEFDVDEDGFARWRPVPQQPGIDFTGLQHALDLTLHDDVMSYYSLCWAGTVEATSREGELSLIQLWNQKDFERLVANLIGHALTKRRAKKPFTVFFANTDPETELFLSVDNESGTVLLEEPGGRVIKEIDTDLATFLDRISPSPRLPDLY